MVVSGLTRMRPGPVRHWKHQIRRAVRVLRWIRNGEFSARMAERRDRLAFIDKVDAGTDELRAALGLPPVSEPRPAAPDLRLPVSSTPFISIIIPAYGQVDYTLRCLASLAQAAPARPFEVLVADDASGDPRMHEPGGVGGVLFSVNEKNLGFLRSCNAIARRARGEFLCFLNNDTEVAAGAIDALMTPFLTRPDVGLVGAMLVYPDGRLQEAGGIVWSDGSAWNYGNGQDPRRPEYNYVRDVDYVSGAAMMIRRSLWQTLGGFDESFSPAYCEDSDLAFRVRRAGYKVVYQPEARVIHHEGISHGTDVHAGVKARQTLNTAKLRERWRPVLEAEHFPNGVKVMRARDRAHDRKIILVIDQHIPEPDRDAGSRTMAAFMDALIASGHVVKFWPEDQLPRPGYIEMLRLKGVEVLTAPWSGDLETWLQANGGQIDAVLLSRPLVASRHLDLIRACWRGPVIYYGHDIYHARMRIEHRLGGGAIQDLLARRMKTLEERIWARADIVLYPSEEEARIVRARVPGATVLAIQPYALDAPRPRPVQPVAGGILFVGGFGHNPNIDAAVWLVRDIMPLIRARYPDIPLCLAGSRPSPKVLALAGAGVDVTGTISDQELDRRYAAACIVICPLRIGAGVKLKVVEALHRGVPVVTTPIGAQGFVGSGEVLDVAETAEAIAAAAIGLLADEASRASRSAAGQNYARAHFSPESLRESLESVLRVAWDKKSPTRADVSDGLSTWFSKRP